MDVKDLCRFELSDYDMLKPLVESLVLEEQSVVSAAQVLETFSNYKHLGRQEVPLIREGQLVRGDGQYVLSGEKISGGRVVCEKAFNNKDVWSFYFHEGQEGEIIDFDFYVLVDDENFSKRNISLRPEYFRNNRTFRVALNSIIEKQTPSVESLIGDLEAAGFTIRKSEDKRHNRAFSYMVDGENIRHWNTVFPVIGGANGLFRASFFVDEDGNYTK